MLADPLREALCEHQEESAVIDTPQQRGAMRASGGVGGHRHTATKALDAGLSSLDDFVIFPNLSGRNVLRVQFHVPLELKFCRRMILSKKQWQA